MPIFDTHAHYDDERFDPDREQVLAGLAGQGVDAVMNCASDLDSAERILALCDKFPFMYAAVGVHPHEAEKAEGDFIARLRDLCKNPHVRAIGEIGLDYHCDFSPREAQQRVFEQQLELALQLDLPVVIHDREAHADTLALLKKSGTCGVVHCFSGSPESARELCALGFYIGFTGAVTFNNAKRAKLSAIAVPAERLLLETDCPYMAPEPLRGQRCDSSMIKYTAAEIARLRGEDTQELILRCAENGRRLFGI